ncbi:unnamed protein product [Gulo gulo]|uniref:Uncharacterized protein n=1 Tax=Gulo gulo TaxID=48420 RepID=A0A9X9Q062_GULGU|nr:unnamed protein product [Gulo gulo]
MATRHIPSHLILSRRKTCFFPNGSYFSDYRDTAAVPTSPPAAQSECFSLLQRRCKKSMHYLW